MQQAVQQAWPIGSDVHSRMTVIILLFSVLISILSVYIHAAEYVQLI